MSPESDVPKELDIHNVVEGTWAYRVDVHFQEHVGGLGYHTVEVVQQTINETIGVIVAQGASLISIVSVPGLPHEKSRIPHETLFFIVAKQTTLE
jgi:hypothetical protein